MPPPRRTTPAPPGHGQPGWLARIWAEVYLGAMVVGVVALLAAVALLLIQAILGVSRWVALGD